MSTPKNQQIQLTKDHHINGTEFKKGSIAEVPPATAERLIKRGWAAAVKPDGKGK